MGIVDYQTSVGRVKRLDGAKVCVTVTLIVDRAGRPDGERCRPAEAFDLCVSTGGKIPLLVYLLLELVILGSTMCRRVWGRRLARACLGGGRSRAQGSGCVGAARCLHVEPAIRPSPRARVTKAEVCLVILPVSREDEHGAGEARACRLTFGGVDNWAGLRRIKGVTTVGACARGGR